MNLYEETLKDIEEKKSAREQGLFNGIPFPIESYHQYFEGWNKGEYTGILGSSGSGKSRFIRWLIYNAVDFSISNNYPVKILYFALEDPKIAVTKKIFSHYLYDRQGIEIDPRAFNSTFKPINQNIIHALKADAGFFYQFHNNVIIMDNVTTPNGINNIVQKTYLKYGKSHHIIVVVDNQSNLNPDQEDNSEWAAKVRFSREIARLDWCMKGITPILILQLDMEQEKHAFRNTGKASLLSLEPNLSSIGDAKVIARSMHTVFALFDPHRFGIDEYPYVETGGYDIKTLRNQFRSLLMLKSNNGEIAPRLPLLFKGAQEIFQKLPPLENKGELSKIYNTIIEEQRNKIKKSTLF